MLFNKYGLETAKKTSMPAIMIDNRQAIPVRLIPFVTGWQLSPDTVAYILAYNDTCHRGCIPSFHLQADDSYQLMLPKEWDVVIRDLEILSASLKASEINDHESYPTWRNLSIEKLYASTFVWFDELEATYQEAYAQGGLNWHDERPGDQDLNPEPFLPPNMQSLVFKGFEQHVSKTTPQYQQPTDSTLNLDDVENSTEDEDKDEFDHATVVHPHLEEELAELKRTQPESMEALAQKKIKIDQFERRTADPCYKNKINTDDSLSEATPELLKQPEAPLATDNDTDDLSDNSEKVMLKKEMNNNDWSSAFDPLPLSGISKIFPLDKDNHNNIEIWKKNASYAKRNGLYKARTTIGSGTGESLFNPVLVAEWLIQKGLFTQEHAERKLFNNLPERSAHLKDLINP